MPVLDAIEIRGDDPALFAALTAGDLPTADLTDPGRIFFRIEADQQPLGYAGLEVYGPDALLRSVVVPPALQGRSHGRTVVDLALREARRRGVTRAWLFTTSAVEFFRHLGFVVTERAAAPATILGTRQATHTCATASMLTRHVVP